jgi:hypothetical protein
MSLYGKHAEYQDDGYFLMKPDRVASCLDNVVASLASIGCEPNIQKSGVWCGGRCDIGNAGFSRLNSLPLVMKQPLSTFQKSLDAAFDVHLTAAVVKTIDKRTELAKRLGNLRRAGLSLQKAACLFRAATAGDTVYLQQSHALSQQFVNELDSQLIKAHNSLLGISDVEHNGLGISARRWFLPWKLGGYGLHSSALGSCGNFLATWLRDLPVITEQLQCCSAIDLLQDVPALGQVLHETEDRLTQLGVNFSGGLASILQAESKNQARKWKDEIYSRIINQIDSEGDLDHNISLLESGGPGGAAWLNFPKDPEHCFIDIEFSTATRLRMSLPVYEAIAAGHHQSCNHRSQATTCGAQLDVKGIHALCCKIGGHVVHRHDSIRDVEARCLSLACTSSVLVEQNAPDTPFEMLRPDIVFHDYRSRVKHADIEVCTMHTNRMRGRHKAGALIETEEGVKRRKYSHLPLIPCVVSHLGRLGAGFQGLIKLANRQPIESERSARINADYQSISCALQKGNVNILAKAGTLIRCDSHLRR